MTDALLFNVCRKQSLFGSANRCTALTSFGGVSQTKVALAGYAKRGITPLIRGGREDHEDGPPKAATSERRWALFSFLAHARDIACAAGSIQDLCSSGQFCPHGPALQALPRGALFLCSSSAPVPEPICAGLWSVAPRQGETLLDENLAEVPATHGDAGEGASIAVLAMPLDLERTGASEGGQSLLRLEAHHQLALAAGSEALRRIDVEKADPLIPKGDGISVDDDGLAPVECLGRGGQGEGKSQQKAEAPPGVWSCRAGLKRRT